MMKSYINKQIVELLSDMVPDMSRSHLKRLCEQGGVTVYWTHPQSSTCRFVASEDVEVIKDWKMVLTELPELVKVGKRKVYEVVQKPICVYIPFEMERVGEQIEVKIENISTKFPQKSINEVAAFLNNKLQKEFSITDIQRFLAL